MIMCYKVVTTKLGQASEKKQAYKFFVTNFIFFILERLLGIGRGIAIF